MAAIDPQRWRRLRPLLDAALDCEDDARDAFLARVAEEHPDLHADLVRLLGEHEQAAGRAWRPAVELAESALRAERADNFPDDVARVGQVVGAYRLMRLLGAGGMGAVYFAERADGAFGQRVALKVVRGALGGGERARFERERSVLAALSHPHIARLYDGGETRDGQPFYTMEFVDGATITEFCAANDVSVRARVRLLLQVAAALAHAHQNLVVHRDIKPANVMVGTGGQVKVVDFGIAKPLGESVDTALTAFGGAPMTPEYAAPEQFSRQPVTVATDVYQFGALCYRVLGGHRPYRADPGDALAWARAVVEEEPLPLGGRNQPGADISVVSKPRVERDLDAIVRKAMAAAPERRYRSIDAMGNDLEAWLDGRPIRARRAGALSFLRRLIVRHPYASAATTIALVALVAIAVIALHEARNARSQATRAEAVAGFLIDLFQVSDPGKNRGETLSANQILERGALRLNDQFADDAEQRARLSVVIGRVYSALGDFPRARAPLEHALVAFDSAPRSDPREVAQAMQALATVALRELKFDEALSHLAAEEILLDRASGDVRAERARLRQSRGSALRQKGDLPAARAEMTVARTLALDAGSDDTLQQIDTALGLLECDLRDYRSAQFHLEEALATSRRLHADGDYRIATAAFNLGIARMNLGDVAGAAALMEPALERIRTQFGERDYRYAIMLNTLGTVAREQGNAALALSRFDASDHAFVAAFGEKYAERAWPQVNSARVMIEQGYYVQALARSEQALAIRHAALGDEHPETAQAWDAMAAALIPLGRYDEAHTYAARALPLLRANMPPDHDAIVDCLLHLGLAEYALGDAASARKRWDEALERAPRAYAPGSLDLKELRAAVADPERALHRQ